MTTPLSRPPAAGAAPEVLPVLDAVAPVAEPVRVVVLVTLPLTASAIPTKPVESTTLPSVSVTVLVTVAECVDHVQPAPQSPQPFQPSPPVPPTQGEFSQAHPVTVTVSPVKVDPHPPKFPGPKPPEPPLPLPPKPPGPPNWRLEDKVVGSGVELAAAAPEEATAPVPVANGQETVYTPVLPALEQEDHCEQSEEARLV